MNTQISRREMLRLGLGTLLSMGLWPGRVLGEAGANSSAFSFIAVNDLHYKEVACASWFGQVAAAMRKSAPDAEFCLISGDLSDEGRMEQLTGVQTAFRGLSIPFYAVPGNHDYTSDGDRSAYESVFAGQINYSFEHRGWQFIGLDSTEGRNFHDTQINAKTLAWLDENLPKLDPRKPTVVFTHFPLGAGVEYRPLNADRLLERFLHFNLQAVFSGHWHGVSERKLQNAILTTDRCCARVRGNHDGSKEKGWFVCNVSNGAISRSFVEFLPT
jgi:predicted MPP superfamily phosphohydrolase